MSRKPPPSEEKGGVSRGERAPQRRPCVWVPPPLGLQMPSRRSPNPPRPIQRRPKRFQRRPKTPQDAPKTPQVAPRRPQDDPSDDDDDDDGEDDDDDDVVADDADDDDNDDVVDDIDAKLRIGGEITMQGRGGVNPSLGTGGMRGLKRSMDRVS